MKEVNSIKDIKDTTFLLKYGQEFCMPCKMLNDILLTLEKNIEFEKLPMYYTNNIDESVERGFTNLPVIVLIKDGKETILSDSDTLLDEDELKDWLIKNK